MEIGIYIIRKCPHSGDDKALYELGKIDDELIWVEVVRPDLTRRRASGELIDYPRIVRPAPHLTRRGIGRAHLTYDEQEYNEAWEKWASQRSV